MLQTILIPNQNQIPLIKIARQCDQESLTLAWADSRERERVIVLAAREGRQTMNLTRDVDQPSHASLITRWK